MPTKIIDLFAGPGGLGEGFSAHRVGDKQAFKIAMSIEKEDSAHRTLRLRALFRQYDAANVPQAYYEFLQGNLGKYPEDELYRLPELKDALENAEREGQKLTLGKDSQRTIYKKIREVLGKDEFVLIGGPPCQAYSLVGRSRNYGDQGKSYSAIDDHRNFLYLEYLKIIAKFQPKIFVMENVKGMLSAKVGGQYIGGSIQDDLQDPYKATKVEPDNGRSKHKFKICSFVRKTGTDDFFQQTYNPKDFVIKSEEYGIPQARHRVILLGIREDIWEEQSHFEVLANYDETPTVKDVISDLPEIRSRLSKEEDSTGNWKSLFLRFEKDYIPQLNNDEHVDQDVLDNLLLNVMSMSNSPESIGSEKGLTKDHKFNKNLPKYLKDWYYDKRLGSHVINHEARGHISADLLRYFYYSSFAQIKGKSPKSNNLPGILWPNHRNFDTGKFADRFRVQQENTPGTTVTSHISKDGHYFIHYDPTQCRSFTVREAARIQTFPDNYYFVGNRTQQYVQVGNAVPPYLAIQIAAVVNRILE
jgi:DNA (cytosine-5)-methyltransferase 1